MARRRGELADAGPPARTATLAWHGSLDLMGAAAGAEFPGLLAAARKRFSDAARLLVAAGAPGPGCNT
jgi:hypothetical protein